MVLYCGNPWRRKTRVSRSVRVGELVIGGGKPVRIQSMLTSDTMDTDACVHQILALAEAGCELVRLAAPTVKDATNLREICAKVREAGLDVPLVADIHFKPQAAFEAAKWVDKVRINPGNFVDKKRFVVREYTEEEYGKELEQIRREFLPLVDFCKERGVAIRIGTNHGSLSDRIMNRYGDSPLGMVESALEFAKMARERDFHDLVFSMKASNPKVMIAAYRLLAARLKEEGEDWNYPLHLGVTEAGDGEDGRIKSAVGIGSLLWEGIGETIRVSLTEDSVNEIPVAEALRDMAEAFTGEELDLDAEYPLPFDPFSYLRRRSETMLVGGVRVGGNELVRVCVTQEVKSLFDGKTGDSLPEIVWEESDCVECDPRNWEEIAQINASPNPRFVTVKEGLPLRLIAAFRLLAARLDLRHSILLKDTLEKVKRDSDQALLQASVILGSLLCDGIGDAVLVRGEADAEKSVALAYNILQAAGVRSVKADYVACPSCGRTLFDLQATTARVKAATLHLKGVKIAVMGCIVNGPGEMADADFGYVGGAPGKVNLYVGKTPVRFHVPEAEAVEHLVELIKENGRWNDPVL